MLVHLLASLVAGFALAVGGQDQGAATGRAKEVYDRAIALEAEGNHGAALALLWEASGLAPRDADVQLRLGEALERIGALDGAMDAYRRALSARKDFRTAENNLILALVKAGRGAEAVERARALVADAPGDIERLFTLALAQSEQDVEASIATFRQVLDRAPRHTLARYNLALALRRVDRPREALVELDRTIEIEPRGPAYYTKGIIYWHLGEFERAAESLREAVEIDPRYADAYEALGGVLKSQRDWPGARAAFQRGLALAPTRPSLHYALGLVLQQIGDEPGAKRELEESERLRQRAALEHEALVWTSVGIERSERGDGPGALQQFDRAIAAFEEYAPAHYQRGLTLMRLGQTAQSRAAFARARALNPSLVPPKELK